MNRPCDQIVVKREETPLEIGDHLQQAFYGNHLTQESWCFMGMFDNTGPFWEKVYIENVISGDKYILYILQ